MSMCNVPARPGLAEFLTDGGEMGALMRAHDWSATPLGVPSMWPQALKTLVGVMLGASQPMFVAWGPDRTLLYNDAYAEILAGKHPGALGRDLLEVWHEIRAELLPVVSQAYAGEPVHMDDIELIMERKGYPEETHFAFFYAPVRDEGGSVGGVYCACTEITGQVLSDRSRREAEAALRASEARLSAIFSRAAVGLSEISLDGRFLHVNDELCRMLGRSRNELLRQGVVDVTHPEDTQRSLDQFMASVETGAPVSIDKRYVRPDGALLWANSSLTRLDDERGQPRAVLALTLDLTARHKATEALRASEELNRRVLQSSADCIKVLDLDGRLEFMSEGGMCVMEVDDFGAVRGACWPDFWQGEGRAKALAAIAEAKRGGTGRFQGFATTMKGSPRWWDVVVTPINGPDGKPEKLLSVSRDVTVTREAEERLRESEARQAFLLSLSDALRLLPTPAEIASVAAERLGEQFDLSRVFYAEFFGSLMRVERDYTRGVDSIVGEHDLEAFGPDLLRAYHECPIVKVDDVRIDSRFSDQARSGLLARQVGAYLDVVLFEEEQWVSMLALQSETPRTWTASEEGLFREVGERVRSAIERARAEEQLRELNETLERRVADALAERKLLADFVDSTDAAILACDLGFGILAINNATASEIERVYGVRPKVGDNLLEMLSAMPEHRAQVERHWGRALAGEEFMIVDEFGDPGRERVYYEVRFSPLRDRDGECIGAFQTGYDISDRVRAQKELDAAQEALRQSQKLEAMGQLTGGVSHDFNNLLSPIIGSLDLLQRKGLGGEREQRLIAGALKSAERAKTLVQRLLAFARRQPLQPKPVDVGALVSGMADLIASTTGPQIRVVVEVADDLPAAVADPNQVEMAILNLAVNARDAMPDGGTLRISAEAETVGTGHRSRLRPGCYVRLSVADTGIGMDEATAQRAIEPFFSTKGVGHGTGLGLSMVHGLALQLGGALTINSTPGLGTNVEIWLPASDAVIDEQPGEADAAPPAAAVGTALLVDDEELVRASTADMLVDLGYAVIEAGSADAALRLVESGISFDLLVTDHLMPGMTGTELARELRERCSGTRVLVVSGYAESEGIAADLPRLVKPFRQADLAAKLTEIDSPA